MLIKTDHSGVILPAGSKVKSIRRKVLIRDRLAHWKIAFYQALEKENWDRVLSANNLDQAVEILEAVIYRHLNNCMPQRTVSVSTRELHWMSPLVKSLLKTKAKVSISNAERLKHVNCEYLLVSWLHHIADYAFINCWTSIFIVQIII